MAMANEQEIEKTSGQHKQRIKEMHEKKKHENKERPKRNTEATVKSLFGRRWTRVVALSRCLISALGSYIHDARTDSYEF